MFAKMGYSGGLFCPKVLFRNGIYLVDEERQAVGYPCNTYDSAMIFQHRPSHEGIALREQRLTHVTTCM